MHGVHPGGMAEPAGELNLSAEYYNVGGARPLKWSE